MQFINEIQFKRNHYLPASCTTSVYGKTIGSSIKWNHTSGTEETEVDLYRTNVDISFTSNNYDYPISISVTLRLETVRLLRHVKIV